MARLSAAAMRDLLILAVPLLTLAVFYCGWRAASLFLGWNPAVATVRRSDYDSAEQQEDFWSFGATLFTRRGWNWRDGEGQRLIEDEISFKDSDGTLRVATVERRVRRGWRPFGVYTIWYDPADPSRVTAFGPGYWLLIAFAMAAALASVFATGMQTAAGTIR
jgi:hypothetical protein